MVGAATWIPARGFLRTPPTSPAPSGTRRWRVLRATSPSGPPPSATQHDMHEQPRIQPSVTTACRPRADRVAMPCAPQVQRDPCTTAGARQPQAPAVTDRHTPGTRQHRRRPADASAVHPGGCGPGSVGVDSDTVGVADAADEAVTVLDRFLAAGISREAFDAHLAAGQIAVGGERITDPATPAPKPNVVTIMLPQRPALDPEN